MKTPSPRQLTLDLPVEPRYGREDFLVSPSNMQAWSMFENWPGWPDRVLLLLGPTGAGKTHLAAIWAARTGARVLGASALPLADLPGLVRSRAILIEDADSAKGVETEFFHLLNLVRNSTTYLVITARQWPDNWGVTTPDLLSRLRLAPAVEIGEPDDALVRAVLVKLFVDRQLVVDTSVVEYLALRIERSLDAARGVVEALDREALAQGRAITRPIAAEVLRRMEGEA
ncbi:MAG: DnaA/Hda family protein [Beijerinckiaceae bacterium]|nr:DnaA/Hda family protein [Beijerinckiaceae bacterium]